MVATGRCLICKSCMRYLRQVNSQHKFAIALYSASAEDLDTTPCFLDFQDTKEEPIKTHCPLNDLLVSWQAPQPESQYPVNCRTDLEEYSKPCPGAFLMYLKTL